MNRRTKRILAAAFGAVTIGAGVTAAVTSSASAAGPTVAGGCWVDVQGDFLSPSAVLATSAQAAVTQEATVGGSAPGVSRVALNPVDAAQLDVLQRLTPATPQQRSAVAESLGDAAVEQSNVWVSRRADGLIDGSVVVSAVKPGRYAVSEKHFVLPSSVNCNENQLD